MSKLHLVGACVIGILLGAGGATAYSSSKKAEPTPHETKPITKAQDEGEDEDLLSANANLVHSLSECNKKLTDLGQKRVEAPAASAAPSPSDSGRRGRRGDPGPVDWARQAEQGTVPYRIPCIRDTPYVPSPRQIDRLGLAPQDVDVLTEAYKASNSRVMQELVPLCAEVVGSKETAEKIGAQACMSAIQDSARRQSPEKTKEALTRVAEVNGGKRAAPASTEGALPVETLMLALTKEQKTFESDLAAKLGPEEAARLVNARGLCSERGTARASDPVR